MAIKVILNLPEGEALEQVIDSMMDFLAKATIETHTPEENAAALRYLEGLEARECVGAH